MGDWRDNAATRAVVAILTQLVNGLREVLYSLMTLLEGLFLALLAVIVVILVVGCGFYALAGRRHFPFGMVGCMIVVCAIAPTIYFSVKQWLLPSSDPR